MFSLKTRNKKGTQRALSYNHCHALQEVANFRFSTRGSFSLSYRDHFLLQKGKNISSLSPLFPYCTLHLSPILFSNDQFSHSYYILFIILFYIQFITCSISMFSNSISLIFQYILSVIFSSFSRFLYWFSFLLFSELIFYQ